MKPQQNIHYITQQEVLHKNYSNTINQQRIQKAGNTSAEETANTQVGDTVADEKLQLKIKHQM